MFDRCPALTTDGAWPTSRILFAIAGSVTLLSVVLAVTVSEWFLLVTAFAGANQLLLVVVGACPMSLLVERIRSSSSGRTGSRSRTTV